MEKEMATHPSILAWKIPWTEKPDRLQSMGSQRIQTWLIDQAYTSLTIFNIQLKMVEMVNLAIWFFATINFFKWEGLHLNPQVIWSLKTRIGCYPLPSSTSTLPDMERDSVNAWFKMNHKSSISLARRVLRMDFLPCECAPYRSTATWPRVRHRKSWKVKVKC